MFEPGQVPRLFALPPGVDFPRALAAGLQARLAALAPEAIARVQIFVNTSRMQSRLREALIQSRATLFPRIQLVTDLGARTALAGLPPAVPPLRRRLELARLISALLDQQPTLAPRSSLYDLADSLATLMDEMQGEGVSPEKIAGLDLQDESGHWQRSLAFIKIIHQFFTPGHPPDSQARQRLVIEALAAAWAKDPPDHPVIVAGSTGSRGATALLMQAVARLPQGALILPGYDFAMPHSAWDDLAEALTAEDHPQFRFRRLLDRLQLGPADVKPWHPTPPPQPKRNALVSLALRPAPVTDQWMTEGPDLGPLSEATDAMTLIEAPSPRIEALAIALILREAAETDTVAALITADRALARQVTAALDRWGLVADDSAGRPLTLSAPGRFLRHVAELFTRTLTAEALLTLLKHPITGTGGDRGQHLLHSRTLELHLRRHGPHFPRPADLLAFATLHPAAAAWVDWLIECLAPLEYRTEAPLSDLVARHILLSEALARGSAGEGTGELWQNVPGQQTRQIVDSLRQESVHGGNFTAFDYADLFSAILSRNPTRDTVLAHPRILIWGTLEARVQGADLVILGGLNEASWPARPPPDPWMNRQMRLKAGLVLPERQIGLSAHDYQQAIAAPRVVLTRSLRDAEAESVPSRWLNRLMNLMQGLPATGGPVALQQMQDRGKIWLARAAALETPLAAEAPAVRPAPRPPVAHRPTGLFVTQITQLIRDPYAVYARHILRLKPLDPLHQPPTARDRGSTLHLILEAFIHRWAAETDDQARTRLLAVTDEILRQEVPWPAARRLWRARIERVADWLLNQEVARGGTPAIIEKTGSVLLKNPDFRLSARPDRIDILPDGRLLILDYKTGDPPTAKQQMQFDKQLLLEAAMAERGGFAELGPVEVAGTLYIGLGNPPKAQPLTIEPGMLDQVWAELARLISHYQDPAQGYASRRAMHRVAFAGDYDHLARFGEWDMSTIPTQEDVG